MDDENPLKLTPPMVGNPIIGDIGRGPNFSARPRQPAIPFVLWHSRDAAALEVPQTIAGLHLWFAADKITGLSNGAAVPQWDDASGFANHAAQATGTARPTYQTGVLNGLPVVRFDGTDDRLQISNADALALTNNQDGVTMIAVVNLTDATTSVTRNLVHFSTPASANTARLKFGQRFSTTNKWDISGRRLDADAQQDLLGGTTSTGVQLLSAVADYANSDATLYRNGAVEVSTTSWLTSGNTSATDSHAQGVLLGGRFDGTEVWAGDVAEVLVYDSALSTTDLQTIEAYLTTKYALSGSGSTDVPTRSLIVNAQPLPQPKPYVSVAGQPAEPPPLDQINPVKSTVVGAQPLPQPKPYVSVAGQPAEPLLDQINPVKSTVVGAQPLPQPKPYVSVAGQPAEPPPGQINPVKSLVVGAQQPPLTVATAMVWRAPGEPPAAPSGVLVLPTIVAAQPLPPAKGTATVDWVVLREEPPRPIESLIVAAQPMPLSTQAPIVGRPLAEPPALPPVPIRSLVIAAQPMPLSTQAPIIGQTLAEPPIALPRPLIAPTVVAAQPLPPAKGTATVDWMVLREEPPRPIRPIVVTAQPLPEAPGRAFINRPGAPPPPVLPATPQRPTVVNAQPLPQHQQRAYSFIQFTTLEAPGSAVPTIAIGASLASGGQVFIHQVPTPPPPPPPQVPIKPIVVGAQPLVLSGPTPYVSIAEQPAEPPPSQINPVKSLVVGAQPLPAQTQSPWVRQTWVDAPPPPAMPIKPLVVSAQPVPPDVQAPFRYHVRAEPPPLVPPKPTLVAAQPLPPQTQAPYWYQPRVEADVPPKPIVIAQQPRPLDVQAPFVAKTWGPPPPVLRRPATPIVFDVSRPPLPHGSAIIRKGFAVAIPTFGRGSASHTNTGTGVPGTSGTTGTGNAGSVLIAHGVPSSIG